MCVESESNIMSVVWLGVGIKIGSRSRSTWWWSWHAINLRVGLHVSSSSCSSKEVTSKAKNEAEDYERERDHHHHAHLWYSSSSCFLNWEGESKKWSVVELSGEGIRGSIYSYKWLWYWILFCSVMNPLTFNFPTDTFLSLQHYPSLSSTSLLSLL